jgi:ankyrin repeat protein
MNTTPVPACQKHQDDQLADAVSQQDPNAARLALVHGANPNHCPESSGQPVLMNATWHENIALMRILLRHGADVNLADAGLDRPLHVAAKTANVRAAKLLLARGAKPDAKNRAGYTPLHLLGSNKPGLARLAVAKALIRQGANLETRGRLGQTPLLACIARRHPGSARILTRLGARVNARDHEGNNALLLLSQTGAYQDRDDEMLLRQLLKYGADARKADTFGRTPLYFAAIHKSEAFIKRLLAAGADPLAAKRLYTPLQRVIDHRKKEDQGTVAMAMLKKARHVPHRLLVELFHHTVGRGAEIINGDLLIAEFVKRGVPATLLTETDFKALEQSNKRVNKRKKAAGLQLPARFLLHALAAAGCLPPPALTAQML